MLKTRVISAMAALVLFLSAFFFLSDLYWTLALFAIVLLASWEWGQLVLDEVAEKRAFFLATLGLGFYLICCFGFQYRYYLYMTAGLFWLLIIPLWLGLGWKIKNKLMLCGAGWMVLIPTWLSMIDLRRTEEVFLILLGATWLADTAAYLTGQQFGKRKLAPSISPGKTWEGLFGAFLSVSVYAWAISTFSGSVNNEGSTWSFGAVLIALWGLTYLGILGDLFESWIKRQAGAKDSGSLMPGHGGVLDRIDSLTAALPTLLFLYMLIKHGPPQ
jgi:phosphatidate cytidylyltransferase